LGFSLYFYFGLGFLIGLALFWFRFGNTKAIFFFFYLFFSDKGKFLYIFFFFLHVAKLSSSESLHAFSSERDSCRDQLVDEAASPASQKI